MSVWYDIIKKKHLFFSIELIDALSLQIAPVVDAQKVRECWTTVVPASDSPDEEQIEASNRIDEKIRSCDELTTNESLTKKSWTYLGEYLYLSEIYLL